MIKGCLSESDIAEMENVSPDEATWLFAAQTYFSIVVKGVLDQAFSPDVSAEVETQGDNDVRRRLADLESGDTFVSRGLPRLPAGDPFAWIGAAWNERLLEPLRDLFSAIDSFDAQECLDAAAEGRDPLAGLYQGLFPKKVRHVLGEFYTPGMLADHLLTLACSERKIGEASASDLPFDLNASTRVLDPACGSGTFLLKVLQRLRSEAPDEPTYAKSVVANVAGFDLNPIAVLMAGVNFLFALGEEAISLRDAEIPVYLFDSIQGREVEGEVLQDSSRKTSRRQPESLAPFDLILGNPPWIGWDRLPDAYREATKPLWERYGLFTLSGTAARHGGGKKDLAMLMIQTTADRHLRDGGRLAMVVPQTIFQTRGAGDGFRRLRLGEDGTPLAVLRVDDLTDVKPFPDVSNGAATLLLEKGRATDYPVEYVRWTKGAEPHGEDLQSEDVEDETCGESKPSEGDWRPRLCRAEPVDAAQPGSPWIVSPDELHTSVGTMLGPSDYEGRLGANSGGANGVYWVRIRSSDEGLIVRNIPGRGKRPVELVTAPIEPELVYPLIRWGDVQEFHAAPSAYILMPQDLERRTGIELELMERDYPLALSYFRQFEAPLRDRAAFQRYQGSGSFYSMYNVGPYTTAPVKVVWRRMDRRLRAAVVLEVDDPALGRRPCVCQETCVLVAVETIEEADYLAALMNSAPVNFLALAQSVRGGKGFGSPGLLETLRIRRYAPWDFRHRRLAMAGEEARRLAPGAIDAPVLEEIDLLAGRLWDLDTEEVAALQEEVRLLGGAS
jgi:hypothetical protein